MKTTIASVLGACALLGQTVALQSAQAREPMNLAHSHSIAISMGAKANARTVVSTDISGVQMESGLLGTLSYGYWFDEEWQMNFTAGVFGLALKTSHVGTESDATGAALFGISYYPTALAMGDAGRPFVGIAPGMYFQSATRTGALPLASAETVTELVPGVRAMLGVDIFPAGWLRISPTLSYHWVGKFTETPSGSETYSGADFSLGLGVVF